MQIISKVLPASRKKLVISTFGIMALVLFTSWIIFETTKVEIVFADNGEETSIKTHTNTVGELLDELDVPVSEHDALSHDIDSPIQSGMVIDYKTANEINVMIDGKQQQFYTTADTVGDFFNKEGLSFSTHDSISHKKSDSIEEGLNISIDTAYEVTVDEAGEEKKIWTTGGNVADVLAANDITYKDMDKIEPALTDDVTEDTKITIVQVEKKTEKVKEPIAFKTEKKKDGSLEKGKEQVVSDGKEGLVSKEYEITLENGEEVNRELLNEEVMEKSVNKVVAVGTKEVKKTQPKTTASSKKSESGSNSSKSSGSNASGKELSMTASAYTAKCSGCSGYTSTGINLNANPNMKVIAVDPNVIPLGSKVWVEGYGTAIAADTGGSIKGKRIDAHFPTKQAAYSFGRKQVKVKILD
ncbi:ubiquitin-like domain-containing protein [Virgibacillus sp. W0181]|uniref:ubiquitin-like domain-containing protein n=1 Tax=Virgibacillus sp. W0181 TaxID=3391581 RepID=UPI003F452520